MKKLKVLLVDDDLSFGTIAVKILQASGFEVFFQNTLFDIENVIVKLSPNIIILDVMVGDDNCLEHINVIRLAAEDIPIIFVSSNHELALEEQATAYGAMVYMEKPFAMEKLVMWVKRYAKCNDFSDSKHLSIGEYSLDVKSHVLCYHGYNECTLSNTEFTMLKTLYLNKGKVVSRQDLKKTVWGKVVCSDVNLNNVVYRLRKYFDKDSSVRFETYRGEGYVMSMD